VLLSILGLNAAFVGSLRLACGIKRRFKWTVAAVVIGAALRLAAGIRFGLEYYFGRAGASLFYTSGASLLTVLFEAITLWFATRLHFNIDYLHKAERKADRSLKKSSAEADDDDDEELTGASVPESTIGSQTSEVEAQIMLERKGTQTSQVLFYWEPNPKLPTMVNEARVRALNMGLSSILVIIFSALDASLGWDSNGWIFVLALVGSVITMGISVAIVRYGPKAAGQGHERDGPRFAKQHRYMGLLSSVSAACLLGAFVGNFSEAVRVWSLDWSFAALESNDVPVISVLLDPGLVVLVAVTLVWQALFILSSFRAAELLQDVPQM